MTKRSKAYYQQAIKKWLLTFPKLALESFLFLVNTPNYLFLFLYGLRMTVESYSKLINGISTFKKAIDQLFEAKIDEQRTAEMFRHLLSESEKLKKEQEQLFTSLFSVYVAIFALIVSIIALFLKKGS